MKIGIIGHFGFGNNLINGQTIKTKILYDELCRYYSKENIVCVDTHGRDLLKRTMLFLKTINMLRTTPRVIVLFAKEGKKKFFPLLYWVNKIFKRKIYHDVIAGNLYDLLLEYPKWEKYLNSFVVNWVELDSVCDKLKNAGINNIEYLPNFKRLEILDEAFLKRISVAPFKFCTFSCVEEKKGIESAIQAVSEINNINGSVIATLDIYGQVAENYSDKFKEICLSFPDGISYKGEVEYTDTVGVLKEYFMLLFPTQYKSEGFPGTIIDAFYAGLPVIASNNCELIQNNITGFVYCNSSVEKLKELMIYAIKNSHKIDEMRKNCLGKAQEYHPDKIMKKIVAKLEEK